MDLIDIFMKFLNHQFKLLSRANQKLKPVLKNQRTASYFTITLSLFSLSFFGLFAIRPTLITAVKLINEVNDLRNLNLDYENKISNIIRAQSEYEKIRDAIYLIDKALPMNANFPELARGLESYAARSNVTIGQLQIDAAPISQLPHSSKLHQYGYVLIGSGDYPAVSSYLKHLTNWKRILSINSIDLSHEGSSEGGLLRISMKGSAYYEP